MTEGKTIMKRGMQFVLLLFGLIIWMTTGTVKAEAADAGSSQSGDYGSFVDGEQVIKDMIEKNGMESHPRIIMTEDRFAKMRSHIDDGSVTATLLQMLKDQADGKLGSKVLPYEITDGIRLLETSKRIQRRVAALALAYNIFGDEKYAKRAYMELESATNFPDWNPSHFLDTAEMTTAFAIGYDWLYNWMNDSQRAVLRKAMIEKGLKQVLQDYEDKPADRSRTYRWYQDYPGDNWKLVCTGSMNMAALAIGDEKDARDLAAKVLTYGYKEAYSFVRRSYSNIDGAYAEGLGYWDYATYYLGLNSSSLISATGTDYGLANYEGVRKSADFVRYMSSNTPKTFSFGDDRESRDSSWSVFLWLGKYFDLYDIASIRLNKLASEEFNYLDVLWIEEDGLSKPVNERAKDWGGVGWSYSSFRDTWDKSGTIAALHTGINKYKYHGHYDLGSFYIEHNDSRFFTDLGNEDYELKDRLYSYRIRAEGHNTLVINPSRELDQSEGVECFITSYGEGNEAYAVTDLTAAYKASGANSVVRGLKMIKDKKAVIIQDEISLDKAGEIYWFAHTSGQVSVASDGRSAIVTVGSDRLWVGLLSSGGKFSVMSAKLLPTSRPVSGQTSNSDYRKLAIHLTNTKDMTITVACIPLKKGETKPAWTPSVSKIAQWGADRIVSAKAKYNSITKTSMQGFTVVTTADVQNLMLYSENRQALVKTWKASESSVLQADGTRLWSLLQTIQNPGNRKLIFVGKTANSGSETNPVTVSFKVEKSGVLSVAAKYPVIEKQTAQTFTVKTTADVTRLVMYPEDEKTVVQTWTTANSKTSVSGNIRTWTVTRSIDSPGKRTLKFKAGTASTLSTAQRFVGFTVGSAEVQSVSVKSSTIKQGDVQTFTIKTNLEAQYVMLYAEGGNLVKTWGLKDATTTVSGNTRTWVVKLPIQTAGKRELVIKAGTSVMPGKIGKKAVFTVTAK